MGMLAKALGMMGLARKSAPYQVTPYEFRGFDAVLEHAMSGSLTVNASTAFGLYRRSSAIATAVDLIASKIEQIDPVIERDGEFHRDDEVIERLARPNDHQLWRPFVGQSVRNYLLTGNAYWIGIGNIGNAPLEVYAAIPTLCVILEGLSDFLLPRFGRDPRNERITYDPQSIVALRRRMLEELKQVAALNILTINEQRAKLPDLEDIVRDMVTSLTSGQRSGRLFTTPAGEQFGDCTFFTDDQGWA